MTEVQNLRHASREPLFRLHYYFWLMRTPCRRRNRLTLDDRIEAMARAREYLERKRQNKDV